MVATANALRHRRMELGQAAWSQQRAAGRTAQQYANDLDPQVRAMAAADEAARYGMVALGALAAGGLVLGATRRTARQRA